MTLEIVDIVTYRDEETDQVVNWGILFEDGSVEWFDSEEQAESYWQDKYNLYKMDVDEKKTFLNNLYLKNMKKKHIS